MKNLRNLRWAFKGWAKERKVFDKETKEKLLYDINLIDVKEEKMDLKKSKFETMDFLR